MINELIPLLEAIATNPSVQAISTYQLARGLFKDFTDVRADFFLTKLELFFDDMKGGELTENGYKEFQNLLQKHEKNPEDVYRLTLIVLDRLDREYKAKLASKLLNALLNGKLRFDQYDDLLKIVDDLIGSDATFILEQYKDSVYAYRNDTQANRLIAFGLLVNTPKVSLDDLRFVGGDEMKLRNSYSLTEYGVILAKCLNGEFLGDDFTQKGSFQKST